MGRGVCSHADGYGCSALGVAVGRGQLIGQLVALCVKAIGNVRAGAEDRPKGVARLDVAVEHVGGQAGVDEGRGHGARESEYRLGTGSKPQFSRLHEEDHWAVESGAGAAVSNNLAEVIYIPDIIHITCA